MRRNLILKITETGFLIALAAVLEVLLKLLPIGQMPNGGHISLSILPIIIVGFRHGWKYGFSAGILFAIVNLMIDGFNGIWGSIIFDYFLAFGLLGIAGFFTKWKNNIFVFASVIFLCGFIRYVCHGLSGVIFFGEYASDYGYANAVWFYSFIVYNLAYNLLSTFLCVACGCFIHSIFFIKNDLDD